MIEQRQLDRQLLGSAPWYVDGDFHPAWEENSAIEAMKITVVSAPHTGADSRNFVYFRTGGHKYLLGSPTMPLTPDDGPQEFVLDMAVSPLDASDLRGFGLGMTRKWTSSHNWRRGDLNHRCEEVCDQRSHQPRRPVFCSTAAANEYGACRHTRLPARINSDQYTSPNRQERHHNV